MVFRIMVEYKNLNVSNSYFSLPLEAKSTGREQCREKRLEVYKEDCGIGKEGQQEERERERKERAKNGIDHEGREWRDSDEIHQRSVSVSLEDFSDFHLSFSFLSLAGDLPFSPARHRDHHYSRSRSRSQDRGKESMMRFKLFFC